MTFVGHCMTGVAIGLVVIPSRTPRSRLIFCLAGCAIAANMPDFNIRHWGHYDYLFSHSIFVNSAIILILALAIDLISKIFNRKISWRLLIAWAGAWLSHLLLDTFYNHGLGLCMFWPFSKSALVLPMPWFHTIKVEAGFITWHNLSEFITEFLFFSLVVVPAIYFRWRCCAGDATRPSPPAPLPKGEGS
jgi:hypothetical protein